MKKLLIGAATASVSCFLATMPMSAGAATMATSGPLAAEFASTGFPTVPSALDGGMSSVTAGILEPLKLDQYGGARQLLEAILTINVQWFSDFSAENNAVDTFDTITLRVDIGALVENPAGGLLSVVDFASAGATVTNSDNGGVPNGSGTDFFSGNIGGTESTSFSFFDSQLAPFIGGGKITLQFAADTLNTVSPSREDISSSFATTAEVSANVEYVTTAAIPLPAGLPLLVSGIVGIVLLRRKRV